MLACKAEQVTILFLGLMPSAILDIETDRELEQAQNPNTSLCT